MSGTLKYGLYILNGHTVNCTSNIAGVNENKDAQLWHQRLDMLVKEACLNCSNKD